MDPSSIVPELCRRWDLELLDEPPRGDWNLVVFARRAGVDAVLRVYPDDHRTAADVATASRAWNGNGAARLLEYDPECGALVEERLDPDHSLFEVEPFAAAEVIGGLIRRLAVPAPVELPALTDVAASIAAEITRRQAALGSPIPPKVASTAVRLATELSADAGTSVVHGDLHPDNVLQGRRQPWLAIDPKPVRGRAERGVAEAMWTLVDAVDGPDGARALLDIIVRAGELDRERAHGWAVVRTVDYWLWALEQGLTIDPGRCRRVVAALLPSESATSFEA